MRPWSACRYWARHLCSFEDADVERAYQSHRLLYVRQVCRLWCVLQFLLFLALFITRAIRYGLWSRPTPVLVQHLLPFVFILLLALATSSISWWKFNSTRLLCAVSVCIIAVVLWAAHDMIGLEMERSQQETLVHVWAAVQGNATLTAELQEYIKAEASQQRLKVAAVQILLLFDVLQVVGISLSFACTFVAVPVGIAMMACLSPAVDPRVPEVYVFVTASMVHAICASSYILVLQRRRFKADFLLQQTLAREAESLQSRMQLEKALKKASEEADSVLNHILKNIMADASGCIYLFLENQPVADPLPLLQARKCLDRGMNWCRRRQAILRLTSGNYTPKLTATNLKTFGADVAHGRDVACQVAEGVVLLDPVVCEIVLDNALANAVRHGVAGSPVALTIALQPLEDDLPPSGSFNGSRRRLVFEVVNHVSPQEPAITDEFVSRLLNTQQLETEAALSEHLGLRHMFLAAQAHGMEVSLQQDGGLVIMLASLEVRLLKPAVYPTADVGDEAPPLPPGVKIFCLDDSEVARRVLFHALTKHVPGGAVRVFGESALEVELFMEQALAHADIVVMDNYLLYGSVQYVGARLLQDLLAAGFPGLTCVRSANMEAEDLALYAECGAHCIVGKDTPPPAMVQQISAAYARHRGGGGCGGGSDGAIAE